MSNYKAITGSSKIVHRNQGGGSKLQVIASSTNLNTSAHVAFRNRNVVCPCNRDVIFCMNQLGGVGAGGIPGRSYAFAPTADGTHKPFYCGHRFNYHLNNNNKHLIYPRKHLDIYTLLYSNPSFYINHKVIKFSDISSILQNNKVYKITISNINVTIIFKVTEYVTSGTYNIEILFQDNFIMGSTFSNQNASSQTYYNDETTILKALNGLVTELYVKN